VALIELCRETGALYLDTCIEPWPGGYTDPSLPPSARSNYALRESALALRSGGPGGPTAVITHGANPGLVSHFVKQALLDVARDASPVAETPVDRAGSIDRRMPAVELDNELAHSLPTFCADRARIGLELRRRFV